MIPIEAGQSLVPADTTDASTIIKLVEPSVAGADARSRTHEYGHVTVAASIVHGSPKAGYLYRTFDYSNGECLVLDTDGPRFYGRVHHPSRFAAMAFPESLNAGRKLWIVSEDNEIWQLNLPPGYAADYRPMGARDSSSRIRGTGRSELDDAWNFPARPERIGARMMD